MLSQIEACSLPLLYKLSVALPAGNQTYPKKDKTNLRIDCGFLLVVISNEVEFYYKLWEQLTQCVHLRMYQAGNLMHDLFLLVCELFLLTLTSECIQSGAQPF